MVEHVIKPELRYLLWLRNKSTPEGLSYGPCQLVASMAGSATCPLTLSMAIAAFLLLYTVDIRWVEAGLATSDADQDVRVPALRSD